MNLGKSAATFSEFVADKFLLVFKSEDTISDVYFSLAQGSTTHLEVQFVFGIYQGGNPFALVDTTSILELGIGFRALANFWRWLKNMVGIKHMGDRAGHDQPIHRIGPFDYPSSTIRAKMLCCKWLDHSIAEPSTAQPPGYCP